MTQLQVLFGKIENCNKWIAIHKTNIHDVDLGDFSRDEIKRLQEIKQGLQKEFDNLYNSNN